MPNKSHAIRFLLTILSLISSILLYAEEPTSKKSVLDTAKIEQITGLKGILNQQEGVFKVSSPRNDVKVTVDNWQMPPFMGLASWASFKNGKERDFMVMGDLVLFEDEVNPVMLALLNSGLQVTALHNHFFYDQPKVYFMHIGGEGTLELLAKGVRAAFDKVKEIRKEAPKPARAFPYGPLAQPSSINGKNIEKILGAKGQSQDGMYKVVFGREVQMPCGCSVGKDMGVNTWAAFAGSDDNALVDGDFAVLETELQSVLKALSNAKINIVAIHHHMIEEQPKMLFLHYWGRGQARALAQGVKEALEYTKEIKSEKNHHASAPKSKAHQ